MKEWFVDNLMSIISAIIGVFIFLKQFALEKKLTSESYLNNAKAEVTKHLALERINFFNQLKKEFLEIKRWLNILPNFINTDSKAEILLNRQEKIDYIRNLIAENYVLMKPDSLTYFNNFCAKYERFLISIDTKEMYKDVNPQYPLWEKLKSELEDDYIGLTVVLSAEINEMSLKY